jgi:hypothetical protein
VPGAAPGEVCVTGVADVCSEAGTVAGVSSLHVARLAVTHVAYVAVATGVSVSLALSAGPAAAGAVATGSAAGGLVGSFAAAWLLTRVGGRVGAWGLATLWVVCSAASVIITHRGSAALAVLVVLAGAGAFAWVALSILAREVVGSGWGVAWLRRVGPTGRVGAAAGALLGSAVAAHSSSLLWLLFSLPLVAATPGFAVRGAVQPAVRVWLWPVLFRNAWLALAGYGPLTLHVAFVAATAGAQWAGVSMVVYAAGALVAPCLARRLPERARTDPRGWLVLAALADLSWLATLANPIGGLLAARAVSAVCLFAAEGAADVDAHRSGAVASAVAGRLSGGLVAGTVGTALLASGTPVVAAAAVFAAVAVALIVALPVWEAVQAAAGSH